MENVAWCEVHTIMYKENVLGFFSGNTFLKKHIPEKTCFSRLSEEEYSGLFLIYKIPLKLAVFPLQPVPKTVQGF